VISTTDDLVAPDEIAEDAVHHGLEGRRGVR